MAKPSPKSVFRRSPVMPIILAVAAVAVVAVVVTLSRGDSDGATLTTVGVRDLSAALQRRPTPTLIDVREPAEYADGHVAEAELMPLANVVALAETAGLDKDAPLYVICRSGNRSLQASQALVAAGFQDVRNVDGGMLAWASAGLPVAR